MAEGESALAAARPGSIRQCRQLVVERADVANLELTALVAVGLGEVGRGQDTPLRIENIGQRARTDLAFGQVGAQSVERDVDGDDAPWLVVDVERRGHREADQTERRED